MGLVIGIVVAALVVVVLLGVLIKVMWRVAEPNEALVISGAGAVGGELSGQGDEETPSYKIAVGKGALVIPGLQTVRKLSLNARKADLAVQTVTSQGVPVSVRGVVVYKVGNTPREIANAASRFLGEDEQTMSSTVHEVFSGHLRSILGGLTMEEIIRDRARLSSETRDSSAQEMETLGLKIDALQIQEVGRRARPSSRRLQTRRRSRSRPARTRRSSRSRRPRRLARPSRPASRGRPRRARPARRRPPPPPRSSGRRQPASRSAQRRSRRTTRR